MREREKRPEAMPTNSGIRPEADKRLRERSEAFARATQRKGQPMVYGTGNPPVQKGKGKTKR